VNKIKIGIIGCGMVTQVMHLPHLMELKDRYEVVALCDVSEGLLRALREEYNVDRIYKDYLEMLDRADLDAVLIASIFHSEPAIDALNRGIHVLVEKPMCNSLREADAMLEAAEKNGAKLMVAYMKRFDPGYLRGKSEIARMKDIKLVRLHDVIGPNQLFLSTYNILRFDDVPRQIIDETNRKMRKAMEDAIGDMPQELMSAYGLMLGLSTHDISILRGAFPEPFKVVSTDIWDKGLYISSILEYVDGARCVFDTGIIKIKKFDEEMAVFSPDKVVKINFPSPFLKNAPTYISIWEMEETDYVEKQVLASYEESFKMELVHFHDCIVNDKKPDTSGEEGRKDIELLIGMIKTCRNSAA
jgi:predicted dehydrogenase